MMGLYPSVRWLSPPPSRVLVWWLQNICLEISARVLLLLQNTFLDLQWLLVFF